MDEISHALIGRIISINPKNSKKDVFWTIFFSVLPDIPFIAFYVFLIYINGRFPLNSDWINATSLYPNLNIITNLIPHSLVFAFLIILPIVFLFKLPKLALYAYVIHILIDIPTHTGEWSSKIFYPLSNYGINGLTSAWQWPIKYMFISWLVLILVIIVLKNVRPSNPDRTNP